MHHRNNRALIAFLFLVAVLFSTACSQNAYQLYYGDTSQRYYDAVKRPETAETYKRSLEQVFAISRTRGMPVPPGLYVDYAMLLLTEGDSYGARDFLIKERELWPESAKFMDFLLARFSLRQ